MLRRALTTSGLLARLASLPLLFVLLDLAIDKGWSFLSWGAPQWKVWGTGMAWEVSAWLTMVVALAYLGREAAPRWQRVLRGSVVILASVVLALAIAVTSGYAAYFHHLPNVHALEFAINEWRNAATMFGDQLRPAAWTWFVLGPVVLGFLYLQGPKAWSAVEERLPPRGAGLVAVRALPVLVMLGLAPLALGWHRFQEPLPLGANWSRIFFQYGLMLAGNRTNLQSPHRIEVPGGAPPPPWNVIVVLHESLRADAFLPLTGFVDNLDARALAPRMQELLGDSATIAFPRGRSNSTATSVSVPSLLTGVPPEGSTYAFHRAPTLFTAARARGYRTFLLSSQDWRWEHFDEFFLGPFLDRTVHFPSFGRPRRNDLGVDDALLPDTLPHVLDGLAEPFFGIVQFNANHGPFDPGPGLESLPKSSMARYQASVSHVDSLTGKTLDLLRRKGLLDRTIVILVADHGENIGARSMGRINSFYEESVRIPFLVRLPAAALADASWSGRRQALAAWRERDVTLLDIAPTLLDLWGVLDQPDLASHLGGSSLLRPPPPGDRLLSGQNTGDIRSWDIEANYLLRGSVKFILDGPSGPRLFDLSRDPGESHDLWGDPAFRAAQLPWLREAFRDPGRAALCVRAGLRCPEELRAVAAPVARR